MTTDPYNWADGHNAMRFWLFDSLPHAERRIGRANVFEDNTSLELDPCYTDEIIPIRPRNRQRQLVRSLT